MLHANQFSSETFKMLFATSYLEKTILDWMQSRMKDYLRNSKSKREIETFQIFHNFINMTIVIKKAFEDKNENRVNERKLLILRQQKTMTIYVAQFRTLIYKTNWDDSILKTHFYKELNDKVKNVMIAIEESNSLVEIIELTTRIDIKQYERYIDKQTHFKTKLVKRQLKEDFMKLDVIETKESRTKACYSCEKTKHLKRNCSIKKTIEIIEHWLKITRKLFQEKNQKHTTLSWSICYIDNCFIHLSNKEETRWYLKQLKKAKRVKKSMMKIESHSLKKSFTIALKIEIEKHQIVTLINEKKENKIITSLCDKIAKYLKNLLRKKINEYTNKVLEVEIKIKHDLMKITNFITISSSWEYVILRNEWKESLFETSILESKMRKNIESQTIQLLAYKNLLHIELKVSSTTSHVNIHDIDKLFKKTRKIWETQVWKKYESLLKVLASKQSKNQNKIKQLWRQYLQKNQQSNYNYIEQEIFSTKHDNDQNISNFMQSAQLKSLNEYWSLSSWDEMIIEKEEQKLTSKVSKNSKVTHNIEFWSTKWSRKRWKTNRLKKFLIKHFFKSSNHRKRNRNQMIEEIFH